MAILKNPKEKINKKFAKILDADWRIAQIAKTKEELFKDISTCAMNIVALKAAKELDTDLSSLKEQVKTATEMYSEGDKVNSTKIHFMTEILVERGVSVPGIGDFLRNALNEVGND